MAQDAPETIIVAEDEASLYLQATLQAVWHWQGETPVVNLYFPTAEPDLNPQKHVWKAARDNVSHNHLTAKLSQLATDLETYLKSTRFASPLLVQHDYQHICAMFR